MCVTSLTPPLTLARLPDREPGEDVDMPDVFVVEDNGDLHPGVTFSCQVCSTHKRTACIGIPTVLSVNQNLPVSILLWQA